MTKTFGSESTTDQVLEGIDLNGKRILVTGVSAGLGVETARTLAAHGAQVVGAARDLDKARKATSVVPRQLPMAADWNWSNWILLRLPASALVPTSSCRWANLLIL